MEVFFPTFDSFGDFTASTVYPSGIQWLNDLFPKKMLFSDIPFFFFVLGNGSCSCLLHRMSGVLWGREVVTLSVTSPIVLYKRRPSPVSVFPCWPISSSQLLAARSQETCALSCPHVVEHWNRTGAVCIPVSLGTGPSLGNKLYKVGIDRLQTTLQMFAILHQQYSYTTPFDSKATFLRLYQSLLNQFYFSLKHQ